MSFFPRLELSTKSTCYHGGREHENGYGYVDVDVIDKVLAEEERKLSVFLEKMKYTSAPTPLGFKYRVEARREVEAQANPGDSSVNTTMDEEEGEMMETQDDELILDEDDELDEDEDMEMDDDMEAPTPTSDPRTPREDESRAGPIQTVNLTSFLASPIEAPLVRPPHRYSTGSYDPSSARRRYSLPRTSPLEFPISYQNDESRRSSVMSTGSSLDLRHTPTRRFSFSSTATRSAGATPAGDGAQHSEASDTDNPLAWDYLGLR
ncbi:hypothetical protein AC1031_019768 [Aphanomyces cochlioides]|nr:hypothetical protein AC1031_019768 [Aphanomyces cochlioides]